LGIRYERKEGHGGGKKGGGKKVAKSEKILNPPMGHDFSKTKTGTTPRREKDFGGQRASREGITLLQGEAANTQSPFYITTKNRDEFEQERGGTHGNQWGLNILF